MIIQNKFKVQNVIIGSLQSGKTNLIDRLNDNNELKNHLQGFWSSKELGKLQIDIQFHEILIDEVDDRLIQQITKSHQPFIIVLVFDVNNYESFHELINNQYINQMFLDDDFQEVKFVLVGAKSDLQMDVQDHDIQQFLIQRKNVQYQNTSSQSQQGINELKKTLFNLAKSKLVELFSNESTQSQWQSMDENLQENQMNRINESENQLKNDKMQRKQMNCLQTENVMNILDEYKNINYNTNGYSNYEDAEQSINIQFEEYTDTVDSQQNSQCQNSNQIEKQFIISDQQSSNYEDSISNCGKYIPQNKEQSINSNYNQNYNHMYTKENDYNNITNFIKSNQLNKQLKGEQSQLEIQHSSSSSHISSQFNSSQNSKLSQSNYSQIQNSKKNQKVNQQKYQHINTETSQNNFSSSRKWQYEDSLEMRQENDNQSNFTDDFKNNLEDCCFSQNQLSSTTRSEQISNSLKANQKVSHERNYAIPKKKLSFTQIDQNVFTCSLDESCSIQNNCEYSNQEKSPQRYHQIHSHKMKFDDCSSIQSKSSTYINPLRSIGKNINNKQNLQKSQTLYFKIDLDEKSQKNSVNRDSKLNRSVSPLNRQTITNRDSKINTCEKENISKDQRQTNSFIKKKNINYLMDLCLHFQGNKIYIDVMKDESSFDLAHKFCKKANIHPTIIQIKNISKFIQQQIENYTYTLTQQYEKSKQEINKISRDNIQERVGQFFKDNKNFLYDIIDDRQHPVTFKIQQDTNQNRISQKNKISSSSKTPKKRSVLSVQSKSPLPTRVFNQKY